MPIFEDEFKRGKRSNYIAGPAEKISDYFQKSMPKNSLQKIFSSYQLQQTIEKELGEKVKVVLKNSAINIVPASYNMIPTNIKQMINDINIFFIYLKINCSKFLLMGLN